MLDIESRRKWGRWRRKYGESNGGERGIGRGQRDRRGRGEGRKEGRKKGSRERETSGRMQDGC